MNNKNIFRLLISAMFIWPVASSADGYFGLKYGTMDITLDDDITDPKNIGFAFGSAKSGGGMEVEVTQTMSSAESEFEITTFGFYGVFRSEGAGPYGKLKAGFINETVEIGNISVTDQGLSMGFGFGIRSAEDGPSMEFEYTIIEQDVNYISMGLLF